MVLAEDLADVQACGPLMASQVLHRGRPGGRRDLAAVEMRDAADARSPLDRDAHLFHVGGHGEGHILGARGVVGGAAALDVHGAVLHQRDAVLRGDRHVLDLEPSQAQGLLDVGQHTPAQIDVEARELPGAQGVRQRARRLAHTHGNHAAGLDLGQRVRLGGAGQEHAEKGQREQGGFQHGSALSGEAADGAATTGPSRAAPHSRKA